MMNYIYIASTTPEQKSYAHNTRLMQDQYYLYLQDQYIHMILVEQIFVNSRNIS